MSRLVDPTICPDCRAPLDPTGTCTACGLRLAGPLAPQLWVAMQAADRLVEQLRLQTAPATESATASTATATALAPPLPPAVRRRRLPAMSVPVVLLTVGALCLLVAAIVFVAVAWSALGLTGRTLVLLAITSGLTALAVVLTRRGLRGGAEALWSVAGAMLAIDLLAAHSAGLFGLDALGWRDTSTLVGAALLVPGVGVALWARRQPVSQLLAPQVLALLGAVVVTMSQGWFGREQELGTALSVPALALTAWTLRRPLRVLASALAGLGAFSWLVLLGLGWSRATETSTLGDWWADFRGWPLVVAAVLAALATVPRRTPPALRALAAGLSLLALVVLANAPLTPDEQTRSLLVECLSLVALAAVVRLAATAWARGAGVLAALGALALGVTLLDTPWSSVDGLALDGLSPLNVTVRADLGAAAWTVGAVVVAVVAVLASLPRLFAPRPWIHPAVAVAASAAISLGILDLVLALQPPLWVAVAVSTLTTLLCAGATWWLRRHLPAGVIGSLASAHLAVVTLSLAAAADLLSALVASVFVVVLALGLALSERERRPLTAAALGALAVLAGGWAVHQWAVHLEGDTATRALLLAVYAGIVGVAAPPVTRSTLPRVALETSALLVAGAAFATSTRDATTAMVLTIVGAAVCLVSVLNRDRVRAGWFGALLLGVATVIRVNTGVTAPELYSLPAAALLVAAGAWRLRREPDASSFTMLGSGLTLALLPSLLLALDEPVSLRGALIAAGGVLVLGAGVTARLGAPLVLGAGTTAVLALRHLEPVAEAVPRWISLGLVGALLLAVGITWEARLANLGSARRYLAGLR